MDDGREQSPTELDPESLEDLYHQAPCGYLSMATDGTILRVNQTFLDWTGFTEHDLVGQQRFADLLGRGGRIYYETHLAPLLQMQREVREIAIDLVEAGGERLPVLVNARLVTAAGGQEVIRTTIFDARLRHEYEQELLLARKRAEASEQRVQEVALTLQRSLLAGSITSGPGFEIETRYRPAYESLEVGGDWFDAFLLPGGDRLNVSVGDVVGRGITAAAAMGQLRSALRALAGSGLGPGALLDQLDGFVDGVPHAQTSTVVCAEVTPADGSVRYACAGHLPPLVIAPDGAVSLLWAGRSTPLASVVLRAPRPEAETALAPGSRLLLFTDGLIERRDRGIDEGLTALVDAVTECAALPLGEMVDAVVEAMLGAGPSGDDVCVLALALTG